MLKAKDAKKIADNYHGHMSSEKLLPVVLEIIRDAAIEGEYSISDMYKQLFRRIEESEIESQTVKQLEKGLKELGFVLTLHPDGDRDTYTSISWG
jgi:hypothetical protein